VAITFPETTRRTPAWKAVAIDQAAKLSAHLNLGFAEQAWVDEIVAGTEPKTSVAVRLTRSETGPG